MSLLQMADDQALAGIAFHGVQQLPQEQWPPLEVLCEWVARNGLIKELNAQTTKVCKMLCDTFSEQGFDCCILKGQANHAYYGEELGLLRACGDVDIWVVPKDKSLKHPVKEVLTYLYKKGVVVSLCYLHVEVEPIKEVPVEVHLRPSFFNSPVRNRRFLKLFDFEKCVCQKEIDGIMLPVLKTEYDLIFQMNHLYRHLLDEGVGLRQVLDYFFLLRTAKLGIRNEDLGMRNEELGMRNEELGMRNEDVGMRNDGDESLVRVMRRLGLWKFAGALMYVLHEVFAMPQEWMICPPSAKDGQFLLNEIMTSGNFGHHDPRMATVEGQRGKLSYQVKCAWRRFIRNTRFFTSYPEEVFWEPIARLTHFWWRKFQLFRV